jgi:hypothetical protein
VGKSGLKFEPFFFRTTLTEIEVEISEDRYLIRPEQAIKAVEPPRLSEIVIDSPLGTIETGTPLQFAARGMDQFGAPMDLSSVAWSTTAGSIDANGLFFADSPGSYVVKATVGDVTGNVNVRVARPGSISEDGEEDTSARTSAFQWSGDIPPQKWMNFYTRVLSRFVMNPGLRVHVDVTVDTTEGTEAEAAAAALRELGLQ